MLVFSVAFSSIGFGSEFVVVGQPSACILKCLVFALANAF